MGTDPNGTPIDPNAADSPSSELEAVPSRRELRDRERARAGKRTVVRTIVRTGAVPVVKPGASQADEGETNPIDEAQEPEIESAAAPVEVDGVPAPEENVDAEIAVAARVGDPRPITPVLRREEPVRRPARLAKPRRVGRTAIRASVSGAVMTLAAALVATMALPSYAYTQEQGFNANVATAPYSAVQQSITVGASSSAGVVNRDAYNVPTEADLATRAAAAAAAQVRVASSSVSNATRFTVNPPSGPYSGEAVVAFADQFVGKVPYGSGASPDTSFGCDGLIKFTFEAFGISLPRGVSAQAASGIRISPDDVQAGDLVVWPGQHIAIADGHGGYVNAPDWGRYVEHTSNWWGSYYFVRIV